jgi:DNA-binding CsgD family transcriptional regulator/tetratricopeptide (TPR) repeat protein
VAGPEVGSPPAAAAASSAGEPGDLLGGLASLVDGSLVERAPGAAGGARFRLLETVREYAAERLAQRGEEAAVRWRHAVYFLALAERAEPELFGPAQPAWFDRLERALPEFRAALAWAVEQGDGALGLRLVGALAWACVLRPWTSEGVAWLTAVLPAGRRPAGMPPSGALAKVLGLAGHLAHERRDFAAARARFGEQLAVAEEARDPLGVAWALHGLGVLAFTTGDLDQAGRLLAAALGRRRALGHTWGVATSLSDLGHVAVLRGDYATARARYEESLALRRGIGEPRTLAYATRSLGYVTTLQGDHPRARALLQESAARFRAAGLLGEVAWTLVLLGDAATAQGHPVAARAALAAARAALAEALAISRDWTDRRPGEQPGRVALTLLGFARLAATQGQPARALRLAGAATAVLDSVPRTPLYYWQLADWRRRAMRDLEALRPILGEDVAGAAEAAGRAMTLDEAVAEALAAPAPAAGGAARAIPPGGLTPRELEVAALVARGRTNPEIAADLVIAERTAARHLENIFNKLGVHSRAEIGAWAAQHGLLGPP